MNFQPAVQPKFAANGFPHRRVEKDGGTRSENKVRSAKSNSGRIANTVAAANCKAGSLESPSRDRLVYVTTCLIGHPVEVQLKNGSVYTGIFHATDVEKDFGIILKMARLVKDGSSREQKSRSETSKAPSKTLIILGKELVQIVAKDVAVNRDGLLNDLRNENQLELLTDSYISQNIHVEMERELKPWVPDEDVPQCPELENIFDRPWNRGWDQFEANEMLFGVKSTFNEELYTTKLERGPQTREFEQEAMRIAREIEGEDTQDLHIAEERGVQLHEQFDIDEETRYSSVQRGEAFDDSGYEDEEDILLDIHNALTFGGPSVSESKKPAGTGSRISDKAWGDTSSSQTNAKEDLNPSVSDEHPWQLASDRASEDLPASGSESRMENNIGQQGKCSSLEFVDKQRLGEDFSAPNPGDSQSMNGKQDSNKAGQSANSITSDSSCVVTETSEKQASSAGLSGSQVSGKPNGSTKSDSAAAASASSSRGLSPSSSVGSLSSVKSSTLNPNAKEFKLNPNAKSFKPFPARPPSPISDGSFYYPAGVSAVPQVSGMPVGFGIGPPFVGHQPVMYTPQLTPMQSPQAYFPPNGPQYGQQMLLGQPRQVMYMPTYHHQPEMPYKGRDY